MQTVLIILALALAIQALYWHRRCKRAEQRIDDAIRSWDAFIDGKVEWPEEIGER